MTATVHVGDALTVLRTLPDASVHFISPASSSTEEQRLSKPQDEGSIPFSPTITTMPTYPHVNQFVVGTHYEVDFFGDDGWEPWVYLSTPNRSRKNTARFFGAKLGDVRKYKTREDAVRASVNLLLGDPENPPLDHVRIRVVKGAAGCSVTRSEVEA